MRFSKLVWGTFLLLAAAFVLINQLNGFTTLGVGSLIVTILTLAFTVQCLANRHIAPLPIPAAVLYIIFQTPLNERMPINLPDIKAWALILAAALAAIGLAVLLPGRKRGGCRVHTETHKNNDEGTATSRPHKSRSENRRPQMGTENCYDGNNPSISVNFGAVSRRICANSLETAQLHCSFGALEIYFDQATPCQNGAEAALSCSFGAIKLFVPKEWQIIDRLNCSLGGVDIDKRSFAVKEDAPKLTLTGSVSLGGVEVQYV